MENTFVWSSLDVAAWLWCVRW